MMGDSMLCLSLLLITLGLTYAEDHITCPINQRYKAYHKYEYLYETESLNAINGASHLRNGPKTTCKVEIEVPQTCRFIVRTTGCSLSEVVNVDIVGNPVFRPTPSSDAFAAEMERYPLKVVVEGLNNVKLYPDNGETTTILNIKRGIISALVVPLLEEEKNMNMPTIHGMCKTHYSINARKDIATDISLTRDLSSCDRFIPIRDSSSPLALISGMNYPLSKLVRSSQTCNYKVDNDKKHITSGSCTENHILVPFSHKGKYGVTNVGKQILTLVQVAPHNERVFDHSDVVKGLHMEAVEDKSVVQDKDAALMLLRELASLPETEGDRRAHLFHKLVTMVRGMKTETLSPAVPEALAVSSVLTYQVLVQCGTPECSSAIMQIFRTFDSSSFEVDAGVFAMGLVSNPSSLLINDMLEMAKYKPSKPIMYALSNVVKRFYRAEEKMIPEIYSVAEFMAAQLGDCSGDKDNTFMTLRVIGNMAPAVITASPALRAAVIQCVNQPAASPAVQQAAIQVYRLTTVPEEGREVLMQVLLDSANPMQKRIAAYLVLMKDPQPTELARLVDVLSQEQDKQVKSFVISHMTNILSSTETETEELRQKIRDAMQGNEIGPIMDPTKFSRNYKIGSVEGNMIFEGTSYLPKEVMLEMTLKAFGYDIDMMEIGMEGKGFEPSIDALFGKNGFFPDTALKTMYFVSENMPLRVNEILQNMLPDLKRDRMKRQTTQNLIRDIGYNMNKLVRELKAAQSAEAMVYLRLLGNEMGYMRTNEVEEMAYSAAMMIDNMFKMFPTDLMKALLTKADNTIFAHYIFMDNEFVLPTITGVPLRIALSGTFTPGIKGGLKIARDMSEVTFMPSAGIEFVTKVGSHIPEYVNSGLEMHTNIFHESGLTAKISMGRDNVKLTIPAPMNPTKLITMSNTLVAVTGSEVMTIPPMVMDKVDVSECTPVFAGMKYCTALQYIDAFSQETAPYFPLTGDSKFVVELHPTGEVTEYTATVAYELLKEGEEGRQKVDSVKLILRAEGVDPTEARAIVKYNRRKNVFTADIQIPDYDVEAGLRLGVVDGNTKGKGTHSISLDLINKNIPQLSLVGRANLKAMKEGMLQVQLLIPSISADATVTANMKRDEELELELKSDIKLLKSTCEQKILIKYDTSKVEVEFKSHVNSEMLESLPYADKIKKYGNDVLDMRVGKADMTVYQIFHAFVEGTNNHMERYAADIPYIQNFRVPGIPQISLPETLFINTETKAMYLFNNERFTITIPLLLGGKSSEELNFPPALTTPHLSLPEFGLEIVSMEIPIPDFVFPESFTLSIPLFGKAEVSTLMRSNLYNLDASIAAGKDVVETPSYSAMFDVKGTSPLDIFSVQLQGSGMLATTDSLKAHLKSSLVHKFVEASISIVEDATITDKINLKSSSKIEVTSPFGLNIVLEHTGMTGMNTEEISADSNLEGMFKAGPMYGKTISTQSFTVFPFRPQAMIDSAVEFDSSIVQAKNTIAANLANGEFTIVSNTNAFKDILTHVAELSFKDSKLSMKSDANALALGMKVRNQAEATAGVGEVVMRMETNADHSENRVYSLMTASLDVNGLAVNSDATMNLFENEAIHKATLKMNKDGLTTSGTTTLQSPLALENTFNAALDASRATLSFTNKAAMSDIKVDNLNTLTLTLSSLDFNSKAEATASEYASYTHDITIDLKPYIASANVNNNLRLLAANFMNEAHLQAELYKMDVTGSLKATYGEEEIKHTYHINYADLTANAKCSTTGKIFGSHLNQNTELEVVGLAARITNDARFNSQPMRFDHTIRCSIVPFDFNLDAIFNADGDMIMYGKHSAQLYGKFLLKAQPLAFASSHECRASLNQQLDNQLSLETIIDNSMNTVLSLQEQQTSFRMKSKMNNHIFSQDMSVYNTVERTGIEASGTILTNILNTASTENQEFSISGFLRYDKSTRSHIIQFPLIGSLSTFLESMKEHFVHVAEALKNYIYTQDIKTKLETFSQHLNELAQLKLKDSLIQLKENLDHFTQEYVISIDDVEASLRNLKDTVAELLAKLTFHIQNFAGIMKELFVSGNLPDSFIQKIQQQLDAINEYDIKPLVVYVIDTIRDLVEQIDLEKLKGSSIAFLYDIDMKYEIMAKLQAIMIDMRRTVDTFDIQQVVADLKRYISSINFKACIEELVRQVPTQIFNNLTDYILEMIQDFDIVGKINTFNAKIRELIATFEADKKVQAILKKAVELIRQFKIEETIKAIVKMVTNADIPTRFMQAFQVVIDYLKTTDLADFMSQLNGYISIIEQKLKSFDYNDFVDHTNEMIAMYIGYINDMIRSLEIPEKLEATRDLASFVLSSVRGSVAQMKHIQLAEYMKTTMDIFDEVVLGNLKKITEIIKQEVATLDVSAKLNSYLRLARKWYAEFITIATNMFTRMVEIIKKMAPQLRIVSEMMQIIEGLIIGLKEAELNMPSFVIPLTDLVIPSTKFSIDNLLQFEMPRQLDIPEFIILGYHTVQATTISTNDIKQRIIDLIDFVLNFERKMFDKVVSFGDLVINCLPALPEFSLAEFTLPEFSFPTLPHIPEDKLVKTLELPTLKLPLIPSEMIIPGFGKLGYEIKVNCPTYSIRNAAEVQSSLDADENPYLSGFLTSEGTSLSFEILNFNLDSTARIAVPNGHRMIAAESIKFTHNSLVLDHHASVTLQDFSALASAKTTVKVTTAPYNADFLNEAFLSTKRGLSATLDTSYNHVLNFPVMGFTGETSVTQKAIVRQEGTSVTITVGSQGTATLNSNENTHKSDLQIVINPSTVKLTFISDTDTFNLKTKQRLSADFDIFSHFTCDIRSETEGQAIKKSLFVASAKASLHDMKLELKATHNTDLFGIINGALNNVIDVSLCPRELVFNFQNKGNTKVSLSDALTAKIDLQNDYSASVRPDTQHLTTVALARLNQFKLFCNFTVKNSEKEGAFLAAVEGDVNLDFLSGPINIPEIDIPIVNIRTPGISNLDLYDQTGLKHILTTTEQTVDVDAKIVYQKSQAPPLVDMGLIQIPSVGNLITEMSFKSAIINMNVNAGLYTEDDLVFRVGATTASVFEGLRAKLDGTTSLTTTRGIKLANSLSIENRHIEGTHDSTISMSTETFETALSVATVAKIGLSMLNLEANQNLVADTRTKPNAVSTLRTKVDFNIPVIKAVGKADADHSLKMEGTFEYVSMESTIRANMDATVLEDYLVLGVLDNEMKLYLNNDGLRSTAKVIADAKLNYGTTKIMTMDVNENLAVEASMSRFYAVLKYTGNNEAHLFNFNTNGKHVAQATIDFAPISSLTADIEMDISQPSTLGDFTIFDKTVAEVTTTRQKMSTNFKFVSPLYTTNIATEVDGNAPVFKVNFKSSATSAIVFLDYELDSSITISLEQGDVSLTGKVVFSHSDLTMDIQHLISHTLSDSRLTLNVDITSPAFTDINLRYAIRKDGISATISIPSCGFLGLQLHGRVPSQMNARLYGRYASDPGRDVDILSIRASTRDDDKMYIKMVFNMDAPNIMLSGLQDRLPVITSCLSDFDEKYQIFRQAAQMKNSIIDYTEEAHHIAKNHAPHLSQVSILFRNTVVQYQRTVQIFLDAAIKILRETHIILPGSEEMTPLIEVLNKMTTSITTMIAKATYLAAVYVEYISSVIIRTLSNIEVTMPIGDVMAGAKIINAIRDRVKLMPNQMMDVLSNLESVDMLLETLGDTLKFSVDKTQDFVDNTLQSDVLDAVAVYFNVFYEKQMSLMKKVSKYANRVMSIEYINGTIDYIMEVFRTVFNQFNHTVTDYLQQAPTQYRSYVKIKGRKLEINL